MIGAPGFGPYPTREEQEQFARQRAEADTAYQQRLAADPEFAATQHLAYRAFKRNAAIVIASIVLLEGAAVAYGLAHNDNANPTPTSVEHVDHPSTK